MAAHPIADAIKNSDTLGKGIFGLLILLSCIAIGFPIYKIWLTRIVKKLSREVEHIFNQKKKMPLNVDFRSFSKTAGVPNPFLEIYRMLRENTFEILKKNKSVIKNDASQATYLSATDIEQLGSQVENVIYQERKKLESYLFVLSTTVTLAPLLGLLGTVWGIAITLSELPNSSNILSNDAVLSGLAMALGTTVVGIVVAIPALIAYNYLKHVIDDYTVQMDRFSSRILSSIEMLYRSVDAQPKYE